MKYVTRTGWGAKLPNCISALPPINEIAYHYTAANADEQSDHRNCAGRVREVQKFHQVSRGWCDIAYNWVVCKHGYVFEGRGFRKSGATGADNSHTVAVCFLGDDTVGRDDLTRDGRAALVDATRIIQAKLGRKRYKGHRDYMATSCPGNEIMAFIKSSAFVAAVNADEKHTLRNWILGQRAKGVGWKVIKQSKQWKRFRQLGGK